MIPVYDFEHEGKKYSVVWGKEEGWASGPRSAFSQEELDSMSDFYEWDDHRVYWKESYGPEKFFVREAT